jgi:hypothetical protein
VPVLRWVQQRTELKNPTPPEYRSYLGSYSYRTRPLLALLSPLKGYPPENAETLGRGWVGVVNGLFHFLEKAAEPLKNTFKRVEKNLIFFLPKFW